MFTSSSVKTFAIACISAIAHVANADQPVHCLKSQIAGYWTFEVSREAIHPDLNTADTICTHELPNKLQITKDSLEFTLPGTTSELYVKLETDYTVKVLDSAQGTWTGEVGNWTVVYDQAIVVDLPQRHKAKYMANFRYSLKNATKSSQYDDLKCNSYEFFDSRCDETMVGVKFNADKMIQCWVGYQTEPEIAQTGKPHQTELAAPLILAQTGASVEGEGEAESETMTHNRLGSFSDIPEEDRILLAQTINEAGLTWTADPYLSSAVTSDELNLAQTGTNHGNAREEESKQRPFADGSREFADALADAQKFLQIDTKDINIDDLPESWDWQNVHGYNFTGKHVDQGHCGSCYLLSTNTMLESRIKIWYGKELELSPQQRLDCNFINEGCHGGWGYFDGMFLEQYGAVENSCAKYEGSSHPEGCGKWAHCPKVAGVKDTYYVGSRHYGGMSEQDMIKEVRARGPILVDFNAGPEFQSYKGGVLSEDKPVSQTYTNGFAQLYSDSYCNNHAGSQECMSLSTSASTQEEQGLQWSKLTHSTLIVGYGVYHDHTHGLVKYWIVRNSYGPSWGESGNLRLRRGRNDYGCESENIAVSPVLF